MTTVERVKAICKERTIPISKLEKDLGFSNGYVSQLRKGVFPDKRLYAIADYLKVSPDYLLSGEERVSEEEDKDVMELREELRRRPETKILFHASKNAPASAILEAAALIERYKEESKYK